MQASALDRWLLPALIATLLTAVPATAQDQTTPPWEIFTGYSYAHPGGTVILPLKNQPYGFGVGVTRNFNNWFGITLDIAGHYSGSATPSEKNSMIHTLMVGPKFTFRRSSLWQPFAEGLIGLNRISPGNIEADNGITGNNHAPAFALGGGLDVPVKRYLALRLIQADYEYGYHDFHGEENSFPIGASLNGTVKGYRVQAGLTWRLGIHETILPKSADCSVQPQEVFAGESITR